MDEVVAQENHHHGVLLAHPTFWRHWLVDHEAEVTDSMRWFKHLSSAFDDERIQDYLDDCKNPMEAYGFYWRVLEIIASQMPPGSKKTSVSYPLKKWARLTHVHHHKVVTLLTTMGGNALVTVNKHGSNYQVDCPNLLKYRDEYSKKSGQNPESVGSKKQRQSITKGELLSNSAAPLWRELVELLGEKNRSLIGQWVKHHGAEKVADGYLSVVAHNPADPKTYLCDLLKKPVRKVAL